ncbi:heterodisulfide reductase-related iron-sulfur binding cluster [Priestia filamentosa]|uniref:heterodisulfide reductase-related iron-sulfur binding cluster n=1 Tax=Priestia filamentosa TaxID=1402861 RepID=UPI000A08FBE3|nr:(Fe-S)-binding protein [Priestia filamentosa]MDT3765143.1 (Fe-S)-binding protein [Priestia filamentosa]WRU95439.1 (Fe-S)-binding protein [Priestia filamentosa]SMF65952.1 Fe-S oxidoreductase [Priestia filamentosa]
MTMLLWINMLAFLIVTAYAVFLFSYLIRTRLTYIRLGRKIEFDGEVKERYRKVVENVFGQKKLLKDRKSGIIHVLFFYGFILVQFGALDFIIKGLFPGHHLPFGPVYGGFTFFQEIVTLLILVAVLWAFHRRYIEKLVRLKRGFKSGLVLLFIGGLMISVLAGNGMSLIWHNEQLGWSEPVASLIASLFSFLPQTGATALFYAAWWVHLLLLLAFLVYVPQSKHAHLIAGPANVYLNRLTPPGKLEKIDFEDESKETFGVGTIEEFTQGQLLDLYACVECGRCTNVCPATGTGKMLSPMDLILKLRDHLTNKGAAVTSKTPWVPAFAFNNTHGNQLALKSKQQGIEESAATLSYNPSLIGDVITEEEIWACTTCRNCEDQCPVMNEHVDKIIDLRRYLVLTEGKMDGDGKRAMTNIERQGNPWGINRKEKEKWRTLQDVNVPTVKELKKEGKTFQYLLWVGSMGALDNRSQKITFSLVKLLREAGIDFAILGNKEKNSGDTPRRLGNEFLFQELVAANIQEFEKNEVKNIITIDPHAYNTFKNEYPDFGFKGNVYHHTEILASLLKEKKLVPKYEVNESITFHDSCYLGRYNEVYEPPREILRAIPGVNVLEMERNRETGMCCGAGGGLMWMEETAGSRINVTRTEQALEVKPTVISSGCPYCLTMLSDGTKAKEVEDKVGTYDVAELLEKAVFGSIEKA